MPLCRCHRAPSAVIDVIAPVRCAVIVPLRHGAAAPVSVCVQLRQLELAHYYDRLFNDGPRAMLQVPRSTQQQTCASACEMCACGCVCVRACVRAAGCGCARACAAGREICVRARVRYAPSHGCQDPRLHALFGIDTSVSERRQRPQAAPRRFSVDPAARRTRTRALHLACRTSRSQTLMCAHTLAPRHAYMQCTHAQPHNRIHTRDARARAHIHRTLAPAPALMLMNARASAGVRLCAHTHAQAHTQWERCFTGSRILGARISAVLVRCSGHARSRRPCWRESHWGLEAALRGGRRSESRGELARFLRHPGRWRSRAAAWRACDSEMGPPPPGSLLQSPVPGPAVC
jgi:hypothetical protein